jgi:FecR protein
MPGTVNYIEGQATIDGQPVDRNAVGSAELQPGQTLATQNGRAEILLTPGVFVRLGNNTSVEMVSPDLANTEVRVDKGRALVEVDWIQKENRIRVDEGNSPVELQKNGLYDFDANKNQVRVFDGRAAVQEDNHATHIQGGHEVTFGTAKLKAEGFDKNLYEDDLYRWSKLRSSYLAEANVEMARTYYGGYGWAPSPWIGTGWYWDPWYSAYTWLPGDGLFWNPWGFGFYSPIFVVRAPFLVGGHTFHTFGPGFRPSVPLTRGAIGANGFAGRPAGAGFSGGVRGIPQGGFRGGMSSGGFHGGGFHGGGGGRR